MSKRVKVLGIDASDEQLSFSQTFADLPDDVVGVICRYLYTRPKKMAMYVAADDLKTTRAAVLIYFSVSR
jgi:hypothetical protein